MNSMRCVLLVTILLTVLHSANSQKCEDSIQFKSHFFECIDNIECYALSKKNKDGERVNLSLFKKSLKMISKYTAVDYSLLGNYRYGYASYDIFKKEKEKWIKWYEENKGNNLKWIEDN